MNGRGLGSGKLVREESYAGKLVYFGVWTGADGRRHRRILGAEKRIAERILEQILHERSLAVNGLQIEGAPETPLAVFVARYELELQSYRGAGYVRRVTASLKRVMAALGPIRLRELTVAAVLEHRKKRVRLGASLRTASMETLALRTALTWCMRAGLLATNPLQNLPALKITEADRRRDRRALTEDEIERFMLAAEQADAERAAIAAAEQTIANGTKGAEWARRERTEPLPLVPFWKTILVTAMRFGEARAVRWCDLNPVDGSLTLRAEVTKSRRTRQLPVPDYLVDELMRLRDAQTRHFGHTPSPTEHIFLSPRSATPLDNKNMLTLFGKVLERAGIPKVDEQGKRVDIHALRGTCATRLFRNNVNLPIVSEILGHSDVRLTMKHYTTLRINDTKAAVAGVPAVRAAVVASAMARTSGAADAVSTP